MFSEIITYEARFPGEKILHNPTGLSEYSVTGDAEIKMRTKYFLETLVVPLV